MMKVMAPKLNTTWALGTRLWGSGSPPAKSPGAWSRPESSACSGIKHAARAIYGESSVADERIQDFEQAALVHVDELYRAARRLSGGSAAAAEDLLQETLLRAWRSFDRFMPGTNCRAWLHKILTHVGAQRARHERRRHEIERSPPAASDPATSTAAHIRTAFNELPAHYQAVILLADVQGFSYREIAAALDVPIGTVMSRLNRGRRRLRTRFQELETRYARIRRIVAAATAAAVVVAGSWSRPLPVPASVADAVRQHEFCALRRAAPLADVSESTRLSPAMPRIDFRPAGMHAVSGHVCDGPGGRYGHVVFAGDGRTASVLLGTAFPGVDATHGTFTAGGFAVGVARAHNRGGYIVTTADAAASAAAGVPSLNAFLKEMRR